jgi:hypothetical protein
MIFLRPEEANLSVAVLERGEAGGGVRLNFATESGASASLDVGSLITQAGAEVDEIVHRWLEEQVAKVNPVGGRTVDEAAGMYTFETGLRSRIGRLEEFMKAVQVLVTDLGRDTQRRLEAIEGHPNTITGFSDMLGRVNELKAKLEPTRLAGGLGIGDILARLQRLETLVEPTSEVVNALAKWTRR